MNYLVLAAAIAQLAFGGAVHAHGNEPHDARPFDGARAAQTPFGIAGDPKRATRIIVVGMRDTMRFTPEELTVAQGETVRFIVRNHGSLLHEMVIGTATDLAKHAELMRKFPDMEHDEPHMVHVKPSGEGEIVWTFNRAGEFQFACLIPGHFEAGMIGRVSVR